MANFDTAITKREAVKQANNLLDLVQHMYQSGKQIQTLMALYQATTDPAFNAAINALFTSGERAELAVMLGQVNSLVTDWTTNHAGAVGIL